jgi:hypothetical protein
VYPAIFAWRSLGKNVTAATNTQVTIRIVERIVFYAVRLVSKEIRRLFLSRNIRANGLEVMSSYKNKMTATQLIIIVEKINIEQINKRSNVRIYPQQ